MLTNQTGMRVIRAARHEVKTSRGIPSGPLQKSSRMPVPGTIITSRCRMARTRFGTASRTERSRRKVVPMSPEADFIASPRCRASFAPARDHRRSRRAVRRDISGEQGRSWPRASRHCRNCRCRTSRKSSILRPCRVTAGPTVTCPTGRRAFVISAVNIRAVEWCCGCAWRALTGVRSGTSRRHRRVPGDRH
jgi:hypothetical protein